MHKPLSLAHTELQTHCTTLLQISALFSFSLPLPFQTPPDLHYHSHSCSPIIVLFLELSGSITDSCSHTAKNTAGDRPPPPPRVSPSPPCENYQRGVRAVSGRACCGGNGDLCSSEETASNVVASCQSSYCTVTTEHGQIHTRRHTGRLHK